jgi:hypothetical protein
MTVTTLPTATTTGVISQDAVSLVALCQHHAVRTAVQQILDGTPSLALATLHQSVRKCAHLDNRPLSAERVQARADALIERISA